MLCVDSRGSVDLVLLRLYATLLVVWEGLREVGDDAVGRRQVSRTSALVMRLDSFESSHWNMDQTSQIADGL